MHLSRKRGRLFVPQRGRNPMATTTPADPDLGRRLHMVNSQLRTGDVVDRVVLSAFLETPRERFVAADRAALAYLDRETRRSAPERGGC